VDTQDAGIQTTTDGSALSYHWNLQHTGYALPGPSYGLHYVDPAPIATHTVNADALEALTAYSPSVLALNDMLRQQLQLTTQFLESQKHMHRVLISSQDPSGQNYTTLEDTKRYIRQKRKEKQQKKPRLTFEEALKQVRLEMGLDST